MGAELPEGKDRDDITEKGEHGCWTHSSLAILAPACRGHSHVFHPLSNCVLVLDAVASPHPQTLLSQIEKADLRDEGVYTCAATNLAGESKKDVTLKVLGEDCSSIGPKAQDD